MFGEIVPSPNKVSCDGQVVSEFQVSFTRIEKGEKLFVV